MKERDRSPFLPQHFSLCVDEITIHFLAAVPAFAMGLEAALTLVFPLLNPPVAGV